MFCCCCLFVFSKLNFSPIIIWTYRSSDSLCGPRLYYYTFTGFILYIFTQPLMLDWLTNSDSMLSGARAPHVWWRSAVNITDVLVAWGNLLNLDFGERHCILQTNLRLQTQQHTSTLRWQENPKSRLRIMVSCCWKLDVL